ncbi:MAG TPA: serine/threonine-protein kinase [Vicinamibacterales bacterium]|nr:serine/threonine-protein kinase [Vicinamibacterales bacterium]
MRELDTGLSAQPTMLAGAPASDPTQRRTQLTGFPPELLSQSAARLRTGALLYAFVFFMNNPLPAILFADERARFLSSPLIWAPSTISILAAIVVAAMTSNPRIPVARILVVGLVFEVIGSFGIAAAQYLDVGLWAREPPWAGLSWVAIWILGFTVMMPTPPRWALVAGVASASSVPVVVAFVMATEPSAPVLSPGRFLFRVALPYLLVVVVGYVSAWLIYRLSSELKRARELGSYRLIERLGSGGMGEVWRAQHRLLARPAAIKLMRPEVLGGSTPGRQSELHARFEREAQATSLLRSPHTIELYDFGVADDGSFYYVMELLDGFNLETLITKFGPVPGERAVHLLTQVCHSLGEAHAAGMIHRDIKPANVYVCRYGRDVDFVKVLDFGLVKSQDAEQTMTAVSTSHVVRGTPAFMSPEQAVGHKAMDGRADIYAIGCLAYWLITGELVFSGRTAMETVLKHTSETPLPPSQRTELTIPASLDRLVLDCLAKNPDDRPPTADVVAARLCQVETPTAWTPRRASEWWATHAPARSRQ